jgi:hypothetical protein
MHAQRHASVLSVATLVLVALTSAIPAGAGGVVTSSLMVPVDGLVFMPGGGFENVMLTGRVHLVTQVQQPSDPCTPSDPCRVFVNLADVTGMGLTSGLDYVAIGAVNLIPSDPCSPSDPCRAQLTIMPVAVPPNPIHPPNPIMPITFEISLAFDETGHLLEDGTTVGLPSCSTDVCL